jgi:endothelin-converting enzyme/putative endopeptidase
MMNNTALVAMGKIFAATPVETWQAYLAYHFISDHAQYLPKAFDDARFDFFSKTLAGVPDAARALEARRPAGERHARRGGRRGLRREVLPARGREADGGAHREPARRLSAAHHELPWMDEATKKAALVKLAAFEPRIGHPATYLDYSSIKVDRNDLLGNAMRAAEFRHQLDVQRLPKPVDRTLWVMTPQTVNAYYSPLTNQITFPAAILQPPFFDANADPAVNYGAIGAIIGHEMGHGFDDQGSQFGPTGKFENWWTDAAKKAFKDRTAALTAQYDAYEPLPGTRIKGSLTLGENIGDLGGIEAAYAAYQRYQAQHGKAAPIDGLSGDQRFFLAYAQSWKSKAREGALRQQLLTDPHSPAKYRTNGVVRNVDAWYAAFDVKPGDALYLPPDQRVHIW